MSERAAGSSHDVPIPQGLQARYTLRVVQILGRQSAYDAILSNPAYFERRDIPTSMFQYPIAARRFEAGKRYAWRISSHAGGFSLGQSEVWEFTYQPATKADEEPPETAEAVPDDAESR